jgi:hypothetical protein
MEMPAIKWPDGKRFAFTIFDDTDFATVENVGPVYQFLSDCGMTITKSVWPSRGSREPICGGETLEDAHYLAWIHQLRAQGFEIGYHMATYHTSSREETLAGLNQFRSHFGDNRIIMANHSGCQENIYWGDNRLTGLNRMLYNLSTRYRFKGRFRGERVGDPLYWGDYCAERVEYVRNFVFSDINTLKACPWMPYHDPKRPYVKQWYASSEGPKLDSFLTTISEANQDRLEAEGGACIMYAHLACGFYEHGSLNSKFKELMTRLSKKDGWFVPTGALLDHIRAQRGEHVLTDRERNQLERSWLLHKFKVGRS